MDIKLEEKNGVSVFRLTGDVDINTAPDVKATLDRDIKSGMKKIVINLEGVGYIDSSGLATLVEVLKNIRVIEGKLKLTNLSDKVRGLFEITKLDKLFDVAASEDDAVNSF